MSSVKIIFDLVQNKLSTSQLNIDNERLFNGIQQYVLENGLDKFDDMLNSGIIESFIEPLLAMKNEYLCSYFERYSDLGKLKLISNQIYNMAIKKYSNKEISLPELTELERNFDEVSARLITNENMKPLVQREISECYTDIDYIKGISANFSIRLGKKVNF